MFIVQPVPFTRINDKWLLKQQKFIDSVNDFPHDSIFKNFIDNYKLFSVEHELYQQAFLQVVTETAYNYPNVFISEKIFKPIVNKRPFVVVGTTGSLNHLHDLGFKTFGDYWSEDYDLISDPEERLSAIIEIIDWVCSKSIDEIKNLCIDMSDVLNYNFNFYVNEFRKQELEKAEQACILNLKPRYD